MRTAALTSQNIYRNNNTQVTYYDCKVDFSVQEFDFTYKKLRGGFPETAAIWNYSQKPLRNTLERVHFSVTLD